MKKTIYTTRYFPFSPGIPWKCRNGAYIVPEINAEIWEEAMGQRNACVLAYGGFLEAFYSLTILEALNKQNPSRRLLWAGNEAFYPLVSLQGLAEPWKSPVDKEKTTKYPVPLFMDKKKTAYFNCLNDYLTIKSLFQTSSSKPSKAPVIKQIFDNSLMEWDIKYTPEIRHNDDRYFESWAKQANFYYNKPYIVIFPSSLPYSIHKEDYLGWNDANLRELGALLSQLGISVVVCSDRHYEYNIRIVKAPVDIRIIFHLLRNTKCVLSHDIDPLLISLGLNPDAILFAKEIKNVFNLYDNAEFLESSNVIFTGNDVVPIDVYTMLESNK